MSAAERESRGRLPATTSTSIDVKYIIALVAIGIAVFWLVGRVIDREPIPQDAPNVLRTPLTTEMKTILREVRLAEEAASVEHGRYLSLGELQRGNFDRPIRSAFELTLSDVSATSYRADVVHKKTGVKCWIVVLPGRAGTPTCK